MESQSIPLQGGKFPSARCRSGKCRRLTNRNNCYVTFVAPLQPQIRSIASWSIAPATTVPSPSSLSPAKVTSKLAG